MLNLSSCCSKKKAMSEHEKLYVSVAEKMNKNKKQLLRFGELKKGSLASDFMRMDYEGFKFKNKKSDLEMDRLSIFFDNCCHLAAQLDSIEMQFDEFKKARRNLDFRRKHKKIDYSFMNAIN